MYVVVRLLFGDEIATLGDEVEVFGLYPSKEEARKKYFALCESNRIEDRFNSLEYADTLHIVRLKAPV